MTLPDNIVHLVRLSPKEPNQQLRVMRASFKDKQGNIRTLGSIYQPLFFRPAFEAAIQGFKYFKRSWMPPLLINEKGAGICKVPDQDKETEGPINVNWTPLPIDRRAKHYPKGTLKVTPLEEGGVSLCLVIKDNGVTCASEGIWLGLQLRKEIIGPDWDANVRNWVGAMNHLIRENRLTENQVLPIIEVQGGAPGDPWAYVVTKVPADVPDFLKGALNSTYSFTAEPQLDGFEEFLSDYLTHVLGMPTKVKWPWQFLLRRLFAKR